MPAFTLFPTGKTAQVLNSHYGRLSLLGMDLHPSRTACVTLPPTGQARLSPSLPPQRGPEVPPTTPDLGLLECPAPRHSSLPFFIREALPPFSPHCSYFKSKRHGLGDQDKKVETDGLFLAAHWSPRKGCLKKTGGYVSHTRKDRASPCHTGPTSRNTLLTLCDQREAIRALCEVSPPPSV